MATNIGTLMATIGVDTKPLKKGLKDAERQTQASTKKILSHWKAMATGIIATYAIYKTTNLIKETALLAARFETLDIVMQTVGKNAGYSAEQMEKYDLALRETGISMIESRQSLARMAMAQLDLNKATELGRIAQDAAVIGNINSSEAFERMIYGIQSGNLVVLKTIGINVSFEESYKKVAKTVGRTTESFSQTEKALIRQNAVLEYGGRIAGTYEAAMTTAGKKLTSFTRYIDDFKVKMGTAFGPATVILVDAATAAMKEMQEEISKPEAQEALRNLSTQLAKTITQLGKDLPKAIEKTTSAIAGIHAIYGALPAGIVSATGAGLIGRILFGGWGPAKIIAALSFINTQMEQFDTGIWEGVEVKWGLSAIVEDYRDAVDALQNVLDEIAGKTIEGAPVEPLVKRLKITMPPPEPPPEPTPDENWMEQFRIKNELRTKDMLAQEAFAIKMSEVEQARLNERYELEKEINAKIRGELLSDTEFKLQQLDTQFLAYDSLIKDKAVLDQWYMSEYKKITEADEGYQERLALEEKLKKERLALEEEFNQEYAEMGKTRFDLERMEVERMAQIYEQAGIDRVKIAQLTSDKMKAISKAETEYKISQIHSTVSMMTSGFEQVAKMGGKYSKEAFAAYKAFKIVETIISTRSAAIKAYESLVGIPYVGPALAVGAAAAAVAFGMAQVATISSMAPPSYDQGGISNARGIYQTGDISEAHIPLENNGTVFVKSEGGKAYIPLKSGEKIPARLESESVQSVNDNRATINSLQQSFLDKDVISKNQSSQSIYNENLTQNDIGALKKSFNNKTSQFLSYNTFEAMQGQITPPEIYYNNATKTYENKNIFSNQQEPSISIANNTNANPRPPESRLYNNYNALHRLHSPSYSSNIFQNSFDKNSIANSSIYAGGNTASIKNIAQNKNITQSDTTNFMAQTAISGKTSGFPSFDKGGISKDPGLYYSGVTEAHVPLESGGTIPVRFDGKSQEQQEERTPINIINVTDPSQIDTYLASAQGQDAILNVLSARNQSARRILR